MRIATPVRRGALSAAQIRQAIQNTVKPKNGHAANVVRCIRYIQRIKNHAAG